VGVGHLSVENGLSDRRDELHASKRDGIRADDLNGERPRDRRRTRARAGGWTWRRSKPIDAADCNAASEQHKQAAAHLPMIPDWTQTDFSHRRSRMNRRGWA